MPSVNLKGNIPAASLRAVADEAEERGPQVQGDIEAANAASPPPPAPAGLADVSEAQPGAPDRGAVSATEDENADPEQHMMNFFRDPKRLTLAALLAAKHNRPDVAAWLERGHKAQQENTMEALQALMGGDKQRAIDTFNRSGREKATSIEDGEKPGTYDITFASGGKRTIHPGNEYFNLLTPPQRAAAQAKDEVSAVKLEAAKLAAEASRYRSDQALQGKLAAVDVAMQRITDQSGMLDARQKLLEAQTALANAKKENISGEAPEKPYGAKEWNKVDGAISSAARTAALAGAKPDAYGRTMPDAGQQAALTGLAQKIIRDDAAKNGGVPTLSPAEAVAHAQDVWDQARSRVDALVDTEVDDIKKRGHRSILPDNPDWKGSKNEDEYRQKRSAELMRRQAPSIGSGGAVSPPPPQAPSNDPLGIRSGGL